MPPSAALTYALRRGPACSSNANDPCPAGWRPAARGTRRTLALVPAVVFAVGVVAAVLADTLGLLLMMVVAALGGAGTLTLRRATQVLDVAPEGLLDEREIGQRDGPTGTPST